MKERTRYIVLPALAGVLALTAVAVLRGQAPYEPVPPAPPMMEEDHRDRSVHFGQPEPAPVPQPVAEKGCDSCGDYCDLYCPPSFWEHRSAVFVEALYLHASGIDMAHAQQQNGTGGAGTVPFGRIGTVDPQYEPAIRGGITIAHDSCQSVTLTYTFYESNAIDAITPPVIGGGGGTVGSLVHHPGPAVLGSAGPVNAAYDIDFDLADIDYRRLIDGSENHYINYTLGARFARLEQNFQQTGIFSGGSGGTIETTTDIDFYSAGIKVGLEGERQIGCGGFSFYGKTAASALIGEFRSDYLQANTTSGTNQTIASWVDDRFVSTFEYEVGLAWMDECGRFRASFGYLAQFWFNAVTTPEFVQAVQNSDYVDLGDTLAFDGLTGRIEVRW